MSSLCPWLEMSQDLTAAARVHVYYTLHCKLQQKKEKEEEKSSRETFKMKSISSGKAVDCVSQRFSDGNKYTR